MPATLLRPDAGRAEVAGFLAGTTPVTLFMVCAPLTVRRFRALSH